MDSKKRQFIKTHYKFFVLLTGMLAIIVFQVLNFLYQRKQLKLVESAANTEEISGKNEDSQGDIDTIIELMLEKIAGMQKTIEEMRGAVNRPKERRRDGEIIDMLSEKLIGDYTERALQLFRDGDYANAAPVFNMALRYQQRNTVLMFYQTYSQYLRHNSIAFTEDELTDMQIKVQELRKRTFREEEQIDFSVKEMEQKVLEMEYNLEEMRRQNERNTVISNQALAGNIMDEIKINEYSETEQEKLND